MDADRADTELLCRPGEVARLHERQEDLELAKGDLFVDAGKHEPGHWVTNGDLGWMLARANESGQRAIGVTTAPHL